jgi:hypothetical protein
MRQSIDKLAVEITKVQAVEHGILEKMSTRRRGRSIK